MCFGYFDLGLASEANAYHRFAILELAEDASAEAAKNFGYFASTNRPKRIRCEFTSVIGTDCR